MSDENTAATATEINSNIGKPALDIKRDKASLTLFVNAFQRGKKKGKEYLNFNIDGLVDEKTPEHGFVTPWADIVNFFGESKLRSWIAAKVTVWAQDCCEAATLNGELNAEILEQMLTTGAQPRVHMSDLRAEYEKVASQMTGMIKENMSPEEAMAVCKLGLKLKELDTKIESLKRERKAKPEEEVAEEAD